MPNSIAKKRKRPKPLPGALAHMRFPLQRGTNDGMKTENPLAPTHVGERGRGEGVAGGQKRRSQKSEEPIDTTSSDVRFLSSDLRSPLTLSPSPPEGGEGNCGVQNGEGAERIREEAKSVFPR